LIFGRKTGPLLQASGLLYRFPLLQAEGLFDSLAAAGDGALRADQGAEMASYALLRIKSWLSVIAKGDGLVAAVAAGDHASSTAYALVKVEPGINYRIPFEGSGIHAEVIKRQTADLVNIFKTLFLEIISAA
jgi:hypothetical protein